MAVVNAPKLVEARRSPYRVGALERTIALIDALAETSNLSLTSLTQRLGGSKATVFRHLSVLESHGYVEHDPATRTYALGPRLISLGYTAQRQLRLAEILDPVLAQLRDRFNETAHAGILTQDEVLHIATATTHHPIKMAAAVGERTWAHCSALGKSLLAWASEDILESVVRNRGLPAFTPKTIVTLEQLHEELHRVRQCGYAIDDEESALGLRCVAVPVRDGIDRVVCAISVAGPAVRLSLEHAYEIATELVAEADTVSLRLGARPGSSHSRTGSIDKLPVAVARDP